MITRTELILILIALSFNAMDFITGFIQAWKRRALSSKKMREGLFHKVGFILIYIFGIMLMYANKLLHLNLPIDLIYAIVFYVVLTEIVSICENINRINKDTPTSFIEKYIEKINKNK